MAESDLETSLLQVEEEEPHFRSLSAAECDFGTFILPVEEEEPHFLSLSAASFRPPTPSDDDATAPSCGTLHTVFLIISIYVGLGLLSQAYAVKLGGWLAICVLLVVAALFYTSAALLVKACDALPVGDPKSLPHLGAVLWGPQGKSAVTFIAGLELFGSLTISLVILFQQIELFLPTEGLAHLSPLQAAALITCSCIIPALALRDMSCLSPLAAAGSCASGCVTAAVLSLVVLDPGRQQLPQQPPAGHDLVHWPIGLLQSVGIFAVSMSGHTTLPAVRSAMRRPEHFQVAVAIAFGTMAGLYSIVGSSGYFYWGNAASPIAIYDLSTNSPYARAAASMSWRQLLAVDRVLAALVMVNCAAKVPALILVIQELLLGAAFPGEHLRFGMQYATRLVIAAGAVMLSAAARNSLGSVLGLVGGACSMAISLLLPIMFYMQLTWRTTGSAVRTGLACLAGLSVMLLVSVTALNLHAMLSKA